MRAYIDKKVDNFNRTESESYLQSIIAGVSNPVYTDTGITVFGIPNTNTDTGTEQSRPLLTFDIPQTALVATLDTAPTILFTIRRIFPKGLMACSTKWHLAPASEVAGGHTLLF
jgi:hypothetical protein